MNKADFSQARVYSRFIVVAGVNCPGPIPYSRCEHDSFHDNEYTSELARRLNEATAAPILREQFR